MKKIIALGATLLILTMSAFASTQPLHHKVVHPTEQAGMRTIYAITFQYCHYVGPRNEMECCTVTATYYYVGPVPVVISGSSNCEYDRMTPPIVHTDIPEEAKSYDLSHYMAWYIGQYGSSEGTASGDDGQGSDCPTCHP